MPRIAIDALRPTQFTLGFAEVAKRKRKLTGASPAEIEAKLAEKAVPHVVGPGGVLHIIDHHHFVRIAWEMGLTEVELGEPLGDLSGLDAKTFWTTLEKTDRCWPIDADGNRRPFAAMPTHIRDLTANPWRDLAREVRGKAFEDLDSPFQEFKWGDYFRSFMSRRLIETNFKLACRLAEDLGKLSEAQDLPGFRA